MQQKITILLLRNVFCGVAFILGFIKEETINIADSTLILANNMDNVYNDVGDNQPPINNNHVLQYEKIIKE